MIVASLTVAMWMLVFPDAAPNRDAARFSQLVGEIRSADYRGDRDELRRLASAVAAGKQAALAPYRAYWRGFALWRRALNGFNETPTPTDLRDDLEGAVKSFREALVHKPDWIEAKVGIVGCGASLLYLAREDAPRQKEILAEYVPLMRELTESGAANPRALWLVGGQQLGAPPPWGGDAARASTTYRRGLEAARQEALKEAKAPAWVPTWGGAEHLMSLAYLYSHSDLANRDLAQAYADGALVAAPEWHYVRDILAPQIQALDAK